MNRYQLPRFLLFLLFLFLTVAGIFIWKLYQTSLLETQSCQQLPPPPAPLLKREKSAYSLSNPSLQILDEEFTNLVAHIVPSVVSIITTDAPDREALLREFFGLSQERSSSPNKMGSGMIVSNSGDIITNWHVVKDAIEITVQLDDGRSLPAKLIGCDERADIAVLNIQGDHLIPLPFGDSDQVKAGQSVVAIGNPFGLQETVTEGIISAKGRRALSETVNEFFQTSALINPGNSGGPLVNIHGEVIGINNFIISRSGGAEGLGFAIPSNVARRVYNDMIRYGHVIRPWFGVVLRPLNLPLAKQLGLTSTSGALIAATLPGSPAEKAGIRTGDVITVFNNHPIQDWMDLRHRVAETDAGEKVTLIIQRYGHPLSLSTTIQEEPK
ncbi:MAG: trypsin-like peptidase domain-containing protein [Chthoniobacterales bacterium]